MNAGPRRTAPPGWWSRHIPGGLLSDVAYRATFLLWFAVLFLLSCLIVFGGLFYLQAEERQRRLAETMVVEQGVVFAQLAAVKERLTLIRSDLFFLRNEFEYLLDRDIAPENMRQVTESEFQNFSRSRGIYDQIRIIGPGGKESIRVNYNGGSPIIVSPERLQDQSHRPYVKAMADLGYGDTYVSPLDLNVDNGVVTRPYKPTIRLATPIMGPDGENHGAVVLNYLASSMLTSVEAAADLSLGDPMMLNSEGYWLVSSVPPPTWGFMFPGGTDDRMQELYPLTWAAMQEDDAGQILTAEGLFSYSAIDPVSDIMIGARDFEGFVPPRAAAGSADSQHRWFVGTFLYPDALEAAISDPSAGSNTYRALLLALCVFGSAAVSMTIAGSRRHRSELARMARRDALTGLANRRALEDTLATEVDRARQSRGALSLAFIDIDGFKAINDELGHTVGDQALIDIAALLEGEIAEHDAGVRGQDKDAPVTGSTVSRIGGDEFVILFVGPDPDGRVTKTLEGVIRAIGKLSWHGKRVGASIGIARYPQNGDTADMILTKADTAMYQAKVGGKNRIVPAD